MALGRTARAKIMSDVAARAGVSHQTVSRVINDHPNVAPRTRARVKLAIAELGYRPNIAARALVTGSTRTIGLVAMHLDQYGPAQTLIGLEKAAREAGYSLTVAILDHATAGEMRDAMDRLLVQNVDAVVALSTYDAAAQALAALDPPVPLVTVQVGHKQARWATGVDQETGARLATRPLVALGHRTVHHVAGPSDSQEARARVAGWRAELTDVDAPVPAYQSGDWTPSSGFAAGQRLVTLMRNGEPVSAVFVANDQMCLGLLAALHRAGLDIPDDVSVVGFDDLPEAPYFDPPLTTVRQDFVELGRRSVQLLLARLGGEELHLEPVPPTLVVRSSTGPARWTGRGRRQDVPTAEQPRRAPTCSRER